MTTTSLSPLPLPSISNPKLQISLNTHNLSLPYTSPISLSICRLTKKATHFHEQSHRIPPKNTQIWRISATSEEILPPESTPLENSQQIVSTTGDDGVYNIISVLLLIAFVALSILTIGVIYIAVTDFLQKRERDKFEKEEATKKKKGGKKRTVRARGGPRGFGQKVDEFDDFDE